MAPKFTLLGEREGLWCPHPAFKLDPPLALLSRHPTKTPLKTIWSQEPREEGKKKTNTKKEKV